MNSKAVMILETKDVIAELRKRHNLSQDEMAERLFVTSLLEAKLDAYGTHFTTENIIETLKNMEVANVQDMYYLSTYNGSQVCTALNAIFNLGLDKKYYQPKELILPHDK